MIFAADLQTYFLNNGPFAVVCLVLGIVVVFLYKNGKAEVQAERDKLENVQEQRLTDAKETRDKLTEPLDKQANLSEKIYDLLLNSRGK